MQLADVLGNALGTGIGAVAVAAAVAGLGSATVGVAFTDGMAGAVAIVGVFVASKLRAPDATPAFESPSGREQEQRAIPDGRQDQGRL